MTFLNPLILWGLAAVSIPIIIHLFNLRKTKTMEFSTLMFLKEIQETRQKKIKLKQLLILLSRIAMIVFFVLAFSKPFIKSELTSDDTQSSALIIIDDSFSMQGRTTEGITFLESAKRKANELLSSLKDNNEIFITPASEINTFDKNKSVNINNINISSKYISINEILYYSDHIISGLMYPVKDIYLITEAQKSFIDVLDSSAIINKEDVNFNIIKVGSRSPNNLSIDTIDIITKIFELNKPVKLKCKITNHNTFDVNGKNITLISQNSSFKSEQPADIPSMQSTEIYFEITEHGEGFNRGYIEITNTENTEDEILPDNKRNFVYNIPAKIKLLIYPSNSPGNEYIRSVLNSASSLGNPQMPNTSFEYIEDSEIKSSELTDYDCIIINAPNNLNEQTVNQLTIYNNKGTGIIFIPSLSSDINIINVFFKKLINTEPYLTIFNNYDNPAKFESININHPLIEGIFKNISGDIERKIIEDSPDIYSGFFTSQSLFSSSVITLNNKSIFLNDHTGTNGRVIWLNTSINSKENNIFTKNIFPPLILRSVLLASKKYSINEAIAGKDYFIETKTSINDTIIIKDVKSENRIPGGDYINLKNNVSNFSNYSLINKGQEFAVFPSNFDKSESKPENYAKDELESALNKNSGTEINVIDENDDLQASIFVMKQGQELWYYFLIIGLIFLGLEIFLSKSLIR